MKSRDGKASSYLTRSGAWQVRFVAEDNRRRFKNCKTKTERDALVAAVRRRDELDYWFPEEAGRASLAEVGTYSALADKWLEHSEKVREVSESCLSNYRCHLKHHILPVIGEKYMRDVTIRDVEEVAAVIKTKSPRTRSYAAVRRSRFDDDFFVDDEFLSQGYRREILTVACMVTKFGVERGYIVVNPFAKFKLPECPEQPYDYWRLEEEDAFLNWLEQGGHFYKWVGKKRKPEDLDKEPVKFRKLFKTRNSEALYDVVLFALRTGLRKGEIGALTARDVNFAKNCIIVRRSYSEKEKRIKRTTKSKTYRIIEMNDDARLILERRVAAVGSDKEPLFNTRTWAVKNFSKYCAKAGVREIHFHSLRHTALTNMANGYAMDKPLSLKKVQEIAGHKDPLTTMRYIHDDGIENTASMQWSRAKRKALTTSEENETRISIVTDPGLEVGSGSGQSGSCTPFLYSEGSREA